MVAHKKRGNAFGTTHTEPFRSRASINSVGCFRHKVKDIYIYKMPIDTLR